MVSEHNNPKASDKHQAEEVHYLVSLPNLVLSSEAISSSSRWVLEVVLVEEASADRLQAVSNHNPIQAAFSDKTLQTWEGPVEDFSVSETRLIED